MTIRPAAICCWAAAVMVISLAFAMSGCGESGATINVESKPSAAKVYVDGQYIGLTPCEYFIADTQPEDLWEKHTLEVFAKGYQPARQNLKYRTGAPWTPDKFVFDLKPDDTAIDFISIYKKPESKPAPAAKIETKKIVAETKVGPVKKSKPKPARIEQPKKVAAKPKPVVKPAKKIIAVKPVEKKSPKKPEPKKVAKAVKQDKPKKKAKAPAKPKQPIAKKAPPKPKTDKKTPVAAKVPEIKKFNPPAKYDSVSPWRDAKALPVGEEYAVLVKAEPEKKIEPAKKYDGETPWRKNSPLPAGWDVSYKAPTSAPTEKNFSMATPWTKARPNWVDQPHKSKPKYEATPPKADRLLTCELRIARVRDGKVIAQASGVDEYKHIDNVAMSLVAELAGKIPEKSKVAMFCLNNRRCNLRGELVTTQMQKALQKAINDSSRLKFTREIDIRESLDSQSTLEIAKLLTAPKFYPLIGDSEYIILGGIALYDKAPVPMEYRSSNDGAKKIRSTGK